MTARAREGSEQPDDGRDRPASARTRVQDARSNAREHVEGARERVQDARSNAREQVEGARERVQDMWERPRLTFRRLAGLDRSGPPPPQTLTGAPWRVWTIPNAIGLARLALIPVFVLAAIRDDGSGWPPAILFLIIAISDYADGIAARVTGQYSRFGALLDPLTDRLLIASGVVICWVYGLLPQWALAVLVARELATVALARYGLTHGFDLTINWPGRLAVTPLMGAIPSALVGWSTFAAVLLYIGLFLALWSLALYARAGMRARGRKLSS